MSLLAPYQRLLFSCCLLFLPTASGFCGLQVSSSPNSPRRQQDQTSPLTAPSAGTALTYEVTGVVLDSRNRNPVPRALVHLGNRAVLTDHLGGFRFPEVAGVSFSLFANKPGFQSATDQALGPSKLFRLPFTGPIELLLSPEAVVTGTVANSNGEPLPGLNVNAQRSAFDEYGHHWFPAGQARTNNEGEFRLVVPAGVYSVQVNQLGRMGTGTEVVLPLAVPARSSSLAEAVHLLPGEEMHLDLRPEVQPAHRLSVTIEPSTRGYPNLRAQTSSGLTMPLLLMPTPGNQGEFRIALPRGTYTLSGSMQDQNGLSQAQTQVTVSDRDVSGVMLRFTRAANLPLVVELDSSATSDNPRQPNPGQLGLTLQAVDSSPDNFNQTIPPAPRRPDNFSFSAPDGVYRLHAQSGLQWYVRSATCAGLDLLSQDLPLSGAFDGAEVRVRISNNTATFSGKTMLSGYPVSAWIYLLASGPSATPLTIFRTNDDGTFVRPYLPPGAYRAIALEQKVEADFQAPATHNRYLDRLQSFTVTPGEQHAVTLDIVPERELAR